MNQLLLRISMLTVCATALTVIPTVTSAAAGAKHTHMKKHHWRHHYRVAWPAGPAQPAVRSYDNGPVCPGVGRSFDCKIWPPPFADDPDRKTFRH
jgi:hypothetical protein